MEEAPGHRHHALVHDRRLGILVLVDQVLGQRLLCQQVGLRLHPARHERGQVQRRVPVQVELVVHEPVGRVGAHALRRQLVLGDLMREGALGVGGGKDLVGGEVQRVHGCSPDGWGHGSRASWPQMIARLGRQVDDLPMSAA